MAETELGQRPHTLPQFACFWWIRSGKAKNFRSGLVHVHRRSQTIFTLILEKIKDDVEVIPLIAWSFAGTE
jgi:hypothetical protein